MRQLVFVHGRSQQFKDAADLKQQWIEALHQGLADAGIDAAVPDNRIRFPYYGDALHHFSEGLPGNAPDVITKGYSEMAAGEKQFIAQMVADAVQQLGIREEDITAAADQPGQIEKGVQNWPWTIAALRVIEDIPGLAGLALEFVTRDVFRYLRYPGIQTVIEDGVQQALTPDEEHVIVAHSLGTVIVYNLLKRKAHEFSWKVPTLVTLGSPLAVRPIAQALRPTGRPHGVKDWFNAFDPQDVVALNPLDNDHFPAHPEIENYGQMRNGTPDHHGISGYLEHAVVARRIHDALLR
ncbi:hypothetical protein ACFWUZ_29545 [Streptomyces sp. NPDC058646]|uniref:hypothetical protein n=1 Tax=Streptomyces sp. NPDC058646 TaxID=3346574 RepID=UPI00365174B1